MSLANKLKIEFISQPEMKHNHNSGGQERYILIPNTLNHKCTTSSAFFNFLSGLNKGSVFLVTLIMAIILSGLSELLL